MSKVRNPLTPPGVRKMPPTKKHRPAVWENILGTVYAYNGKAVRYFDYDWEAAWKYAGVTEGVDPRLYKVNKHVNYTDSRNEPRFGRLVLWVKEG